MSKALVLIVVEGGIVQDVIVEGNAQYHVLDWDVDAGEIAELPEEFAKRWPEVAQNVLIANSEAEETD